MSNLRSFKEAIALRLQQPFRNLKHEWNLGNLIRLTEEESAQRACSPAERQRGKLERMVAHEASVMTGMTFEQAMYVMDANSVYLEGQKPVLSL